MSADIYKRVTFFFLILTLLPVALYADTSIININTASVIELKTLNGIGDVKAQAIIDYRNSHGSFQKIDDVKNVSGIGEVTFSNIKNFITVSDTNSNTQPQLDNTQSDNATTTTEEVVTPPPVTVDSSPNVIDTNSSVHYGSSSLSTKKIAPLALSAGRNRLGSVGSPLEFKAETDLNYTRSSSFKWNFGDGSEGLGEVLSHTYEYPGEYLVVLNASISGVGQGVARVNVKIIDPELSLVLATPRKIEIKNSSLYEVSLFGRALVSRGQVFLFPQDTIIKSGQSLSFSNKVTTLSPIGLRDVDFIVLGERRNQQDIVVEMEKQRLEKIAHLENQILVLRRQMANASRHASSGQPLSDRIVNNTEVQAPEESKNPDSQTALVLKAVSDESSNRIEEWFDMVKRFFLRTK